MNDLVESVIIPKDTQEQSRHWNRCLYCMNTQAFWKALFCNDESLVCCGTGRLRKLRRVRECGFEPVSCRPPVSPTLVLTIGVNAGGGCGAPELQIMSFISLHLFNRRPAAVGWVNRGPWMLESTCYEIDLLRRTEGQQNNTKMHLTIKVLPD